MNEEEVKKDELKNIERVSTFETLPFHTHNGFDSTKIDYKDLKGRKFAGCVTLIGTSAATATNYGVVFLNRVAPCYLSYASEIHQTAGSDAGAVTLTLEKLTGTQAPDAGQVMLSGTFNLKGTANTEQAGTMTTTIANRNLALGDRICLKDSGTLTAVANVTVYIELTFS